MMSKFQIKKKSSDLENVSTGEEGTVEAPAAAHTCGILAFRSLVLATRAGV